MQHKHLLLKPGCSWFTSGDLPALLFLNRSVQRFAKPKGGMSVHPAFFIIRFSAEPEEEPAFLLTPEH
jgi:hypothetical protein